MKTALLFSGQGAQQKGMGIDLMADPLFASTIQAASTATGLDLVKIMQDKADELAQTKNVQPALVAVSLGLYRMLKRDTDLAVAGMIGLSLGEYAALLASGGLAFTSGLALLAARGRYMQAVADTTPSAMAALLKPDVKAVVALCEEISATGELVAIANYNTHKQVVIGGTTAGVAQAVTAIKAAHAASRVIPLAVSGAFHTALFAPAGRQLAPKLAATPVTDPTVPVISNTTGQPFKAATMRDVLARQLAVPTHFGTGLQSLVAQTGAQATLELGPGKTLTSFAKAEVPQLAHYHISNLTEYEAFVTEVVHGTAK